ncbi:class D sortase [Seongchinamella unica]|uniref:Class D sortase n=2 Tax=Seongchinamella unica TaxID=2547392 RepID=A0A4R5LTI0_9GAMM|nr:class D sortase [Seongchinamella unica]
MLAVEDTRLSWQTVSPSGNERFSDAGEPDMTLWAPGRIADYQASLSADLPPVLGVLEVPDIDLKVPVYQTASDMVMDRAAGVIDGMAYPHEGGNIGISGHRDGYFRVLKDVEVGDSIVLQTLEGEKRFTVDAIHIVDKTDTQLLKDTRDTTVTLVTCYPFYFVGNAPQRFIVTASLDTTYVNHN